MASLIHWAQAFHKGHTQCTKVLLRPLEELALPLIFGEANSQTQAGNTSLEWRALAITPRYNL